MDYEAAKQSHLRLLPELQWERLLLPIVCQAKGFDRARLLFAQKSDKGGPVVFLQEFVIFRQMFHPALGDGRLHNANGLVEIPLGDGDISHKLKSKEKVLCGGGSFDR